MLSSWSLVPRTPHDALERRVVDSAGLLTDELWPEAFGADSEDVATPGLFGLSCLRLFARRATCGCHPTIGTTPVHLFDVVTDQCQGKSPPTFQLDAADHLRLRTCTVSLFFGSVCLAALTHLTSRLFLTDILLIRVLLSMKNVLSFPPSSRTSEAALGPSEAMF